jgi:hypothetical protein
VTPGQAGYSATPLAKKLGVKEGHRLLLFEAPADWTVPDLPGGVATRRRSGSRLPGTLDADVVIAFFTAAARLAKIGPDLARRLPDAAALWVAWPRRAGGHDSDITDQVPRDVLLPIGVVDVKVAALDPDWSGLKFVWRLEQRGARAQG